MTKDLDVTPSEPGSSAAAATGGNADICAHPSDVDPRPARGGWAPGNYLCHCRSCGSVFGGDKRSIKCAPCAYKEILALRSRSPSSVATITNAEVAELVEKLTKYRPKNEWGDGEQHVICDEAAAALTRLAGENEMMREALEKLRMTSRVLLQNAEGCAINHYGEDFALHGPPGWLADSENDIANAEAILALKVQPTAAAESPSRLEGVNTSDSTIASLVAERDRIRAETFEECAKVADEAAQSNFKAAETWEESDHEDATAFYDMAQGASSTAKSIASEIRARSALPASPEGDE